MAELNEAHFMIHSKNKAEEQLKQLLTQFTSDDLIDLIMKIKEDK